MTWFERLISHRQRWLSSHALTNLLTYLVALPIIFVLVAISGRAITWTVLLLPFIMLIQGTLIVGLSLFIATWNVFYRDVQQIAGVAVMLWFYLTPVFYSLENVGREYRIAIHAESHGGPRSILSSHSV